VLRECVALVRRGFPPDWAFSLSNDMRVAFLVILGDLDGGVFDWSSGTWKERR
jgi:hypothetical protein